MLLRIVSMTWCSRCGTAVPRESAGSGERVGWCGHCRQIFELPVFLMPGWVAGIMALLTIKLQSGL